MQISGYGNNKTKKLCTDPKYANRILGELVSERLSAAINFIENAESMKDIAVMPMFDYIHLSEI